MLILNKCKLIVKQGQFTIPITFPFLNNFFSVLGQALIVASRSKETPRTESPLKSRDYHYII